MTSICFLLILTTTVFSILPSLASEEETDNVLLENLNVPHGLTIDLAGNIYFVEHNSGVLKLLPANSSQTVTLLQDLSYPYAVAVDYGRGKIYFTEKVNGTLKMLLKDADSPVLIASGLGDIYGIANDFLGNLYLTKWGNSVQGEAGSILKIDRNNNVSTLLEGLNNPIGITLDRDDNIYFTEYGNNGKGSLKVFYKNGTVTTLANVFGTPAGVTVDWFGNVYFTDYTNGLIMKYSHVFRDVSIVADNLIKPWGLALDYMEVAPGEFSPTPRYLYVTTSTPDGTLTRIDVEWSRVVIVGSSNEVRLTIPKIGSGHTIEVNMERSGIPISSIAFTVENIVRDVSINITKSNIKPDAFKKQPKGEIYQYITFDLKNINVEDISNVKAFLRIEKTWIDTNKIDISDIEFQMYSQGKWSTFQTVKTGEDSKYVYYQAELPSLYGLAIIEKAEGDAGFTIMLGGIIATVVAVSIASIFLLRRRKKAEKPEKLSKKKKKKKRRY